METSYNLDTMVKNSPPTPKETYKSDVFFAGVIEQISNFFHDEIFCDVTLISNDKCKVQAHKMVLSAASKYFLAMFGGSLRESSDKEVNFPQIDGHSLNLVTHYIYTASIELTIDTVEKIVKTAHLFELESLKVLCCDFIAKQLDPSNCLGIALFAEQYNMNKLYSISEKFVCHNFEIVCTETEFFNLSVDQLSKFLSNSELRAESEETIYECFASWIEHDKENRKQFIENLLHCIRLPLMRPSFIVDVIEPICETIECKELLYKAMKWHLLPEKRSSLFDDKLTEQRIFSYTLTAVSGWDGENSNGLKVGLFNYSLNKWIYEIWPAPLRRRNNFAATLFKGKLIIAGGNSSYNSIESLDLKTLQWKELAPMNVNRHSFGITTLDDCMYAFGGKIYDIYNNVAYNYRTYVHNYVANINFTKSIEQWNPKTNRWNIVCKDFHDILSEQRCSGKCYLFTKQRTLCAAVKTDNDMVFHSYDPSTNLWNKFWLEFFSDFLGAGTVTNAKDELFVVVGRKYILKINLQDDSRKRIPIDCITDQFTSCEVFGNKVVIFGDKEFKVYYPFTNKWRSIPPLDNNYGRVVLVTNY